MAAAADDQDCEEDMALDPTSLPEGGVPKPAPVLLSGMRVVPTGYASGVVAHFHYSDRSDSKPAAVLHKINEQGVKVTCKLHAKCTCWLTVRGFSFDKAQADLAKWMSTARDVDENRHWQQARALNKSYGMRVR